MDDIEKYNKTGYIAPTVRGHNAGVCPSLKDGEVVFSIEEERLSRRKYDGDPMSMVEILKYTDKIDYPVVAPHKV